MASKGDNVGIFVREATHTDGRMAKTADIKKDLDLSKQQAKNLMSPEQAKAHMKKVDTQRKKAEEQKTTTMVQELCDWFQTTMDLPADSYTADDGDPASIVEKFFDSLQSGLLLGNMVTKCAPKTLEYKTATKGMQFRETAAGTFHARDNIYYFGQCCLKLGLHHVNIFEVEDLVLRRSDRNVVNCLLGLARVGAQNGVKPPQVIQFELDIEAMEAEDKVADAMMEDAYEEVTGTNLPYKPAKGDEIDKALARELNSKKIDLNIKKIEGKTGLYLVHGKRVHVRVVRGTVLIRVGGGWMDIVSFSNRKFTARTAPKKHLLGASNSKTVTSEQSSGGVSKKTEVKTKTTKGGVVSSSEAKKRKTQGGASPKPMALSGTVKTQAKRKATSPKADPNASFSGIVRPKSPSSKKKKPKTAVTARPKKQTAAERRAEEAKLREENEAKEKEEEKKQRQEAKKRAKKAEEEAEARAEGARQAQELQKQREAQALAAEQRLADERKAQEEALRAAKKAKCCIIL